MELLFDSDMDIESYGKFVVKSSASNSSFFSQLLRELTLCLAAKHNKRYTECFLYLYRLLEYISVAFPLLYASSEKDFKKSHEFLQGLLSTEKDGDLKVLERAMPVIGNGSGLHHITFEFSVSGYDASFVSNLRNQFEVILSSGSKPLRSVVVEQEGDTILSVLFNSMSAFISHARNRIFHYRTRESNFDLGLLGGSELLCKVLVSEGIYWFSILFSEMAKTLAKR